MNTLLKGKNAVVTGGTRGIGKAIAERFLASGANVAIIGTNSERGETVAKNIGARFYALDVSDRNAVEATMKQILEEMGSIDILVNNAGITRDKLLMKLTPEDWDDVLTTNLTSVYHTCQAVIRPMMKARSGKIINITSIVGLTGNAGQTNYAASKAGMIGFTKSLAKELGSRQVCVNCIAPGFIQTDMTDVLPEAVKEALLAQIPMGRLGAPEDIANAALYLASPFGDYITGQVLTVDGGMTM